MAKVTKKLVCGVGINDADYQVQKYEKVGGKTVRVWICPFYQKWKSMLERCYSEKYQRDKQSYVVCKVTQEWHYFMTFRAWMVEQDWEGKQLDKDILFPDNRVYGPDTCVFVDNLTNNFVTERRISAGQWPVGVCFYKNYQKFNAHCSEPLTGNRKNLGYFDSAQEAYNAWLDFKLSQARILAAKQDDPRISAALIDRYENYAKYFPQPT